MVSLITSSTVCKKFKMQLLALSLLVSIHHTSLPVLKSLHWLPVNSHFNFKICCIIHCALSLHEPHYLSSLFSLRPNFHSLHSSSFSPLLLPYFNKKSHGFRSFHMLHLISGITYLIIFELHQPICRLEKI